MKKRDIAYIILELIICVFNIVVTCIYGTSLVVDIMLWLLTFVMFFTIVYISNFNDYCIKDLKLTRHLYNQLLEDYIKLNEKLCNLQKQNQAELEQYIQDTYNPPVDENI